MDGSQAHPAFQHQHGRWCYFTTWHPDPNVALQRLRRQLFRAQAYDMDYREDLARATRLLAAWRAHSAADLPVEEQGAYRALRESLRPAPPGLRGLLWVSVRFQLALAARRLRHPPRTIRDLRRQAGPAGTGSALDIDRAFSDRRRPAKRPVARPAPPGYLRDELGTDHPCHRTVDQRAGRLMARLSPGDAWYFPVFADGKPMEYAFVGCSGEI